MKGFLFENHAVDLDPRTAKVQGSWRVGSKNVRRKNPWAHDSDLVHFFYQQIKKVECPVVLDVGAATGSFCLLPKFHLGMRVWAFEPEPKLFDILIANIGLNQIEDRVFTFQVALSDKNGYAKLQIPYGGGKRWTNRSSLGRGLDYLKPEGWEEVEVPTYRLDEFELSPDAIKIDVEGGELLVLRGAEETIRKYKPCVLMEYRPRDITGRFGFNAEAPIELLKSWGYEKFQRVGREDLWCSYG